MGGNRGIRRPQTRPMIETSGRVVGSVSDCNNMKCDDTKLVRSAAIFFIG